MVIYFNYLYSLSIRFFYRLHTVHDMFSGIMKSIKIALFVFSLIVSISIQAQPSQEFSSSEILHKLKQSDRSYI